MEKDDIYRFQKEEYDLIKIADSYGWLDEIKKYYFNKHNGKYIKTNLPIKNNFDINIEKILSFLDSN